MTYLQYAISIIEDNLHTKVFSIKLLDEEDHDNLLFLVNFEYVVRLGKEHVLDEPFRSKGNEYALYAALAKKDYGLPIAPFIFFSNKRDKVERFVDGIPFKKEEADMIQTESIIDAIVALHGADIDVPPFDPFARFRHYKAGNRKTLPDAFEAKILKRFNEIYESRPLVLSHNHLCGENIRLHENGATLLDLSFVGKNTPLFDLASFLEENELDTDLARKCLVRFSSLTLDSPYTFEELRATMLFLDAFWYYYASSMYRKTKQNRFKILAEIKKKRFLFAFEASLMEEEK